jgi:hypothetical protein
MASVHKKVAKHMPMVIHKAIILVSSVRPRRARMHVAALMNATACAMIYLAQITTRTHAKTVATICTQGFRRHARQLQRLQRH